MTNTKELTGYILLGIILLAGTTYTAYNTGIEKTCRTGNGWEINNTITIDGQEIYEAYCPYKTVEWEYSYCSSFRATATKDRYGCDEVLLIEQESIVDKNNDGEVVVCKQTGCISKPYFDFS